MTEDAHAFLGSVSRPEDSVNLVITTTLPAFLSDQAVTGHRTVSDPNAHQSTTPPCLRQQNETPANAGEESDSLTGAQHRYVRHQPTCTCTPRTVWGNMFGVSRGRHCASQTTTNIWPTTRAQQKTKVTWPEPGSRRSTSPRLCAAEGPSRWRRGANPFANPTPEHSGLYGRSETSGPGLQQQSARTSMSTSWGPGHVSERDVAAPRRPRPSRGRHRRPQTHASAACQS
jgi:hypothetical protein